MGDVADMMIDGTLCEGCGVFLDGDTPGYPRYCASCEKDNIHFAGGEVCRKTPKPSTLVKCPKCSKVVNAQGLGQHDRAKHGG